MQPSLHVHSFRQAVLQTPHRRMQDSKRHALGGLLAYSLLHQHPLLQSDLQQSSLRMEEADLVVFEHRNGGRAVRVRTAKADALVLVFLHSRECLHANLFVPDSGKTPPGAIHLRSVLYGLEKHDSFVERMAGEKHHLGAVHSAADDFLRTRLEDTLSTLGVGGHRGAM